MQWRGPYTVVQKINELDYRIKVNNKVKSFHINNLKKYIPRLEPEAGTCMSIFDQPFSLENACAVGTYEPNSEDADLTEDTEYSESIVPMPRADRKENIGDVKLSDELTADERTMLLKTLQQYDETLTDVPGRTDVITCDIKLTTDQPIRSRAYPVPYSVRQIIKDEVTSMLSLGVIERSESPYASPIVLVKKKDSSIRFCVDFRKLNRVTIFDPEPMPNAEDLFALLNKARYLSKIDLSKGYWQVPMSPGSVEKTSFLTPDGQYAFLYMPFGLVNSSQVFTRMMRKLFSDVQGVVNYIDDLLIFSDKWEEHLAKVSEVF